MAILFIRLIYTHNDVVDYNHGFDHISHNYASKDDLITAFKDHEVKCGSGDMHSTGLNHNHLSKGADASVYSSKSLFNEYDKYGNIISNNGLISNQGYVMKGALNRILSSSLESGVSLEEAALNSRIGAFKSNISSEGGYLGYNSSSLGGSSINGTFGGSSVKGYNPRMDENLLGSSDPNILKNIRCNHPTNGYGHIYCKDDKIIGEHYDLTNRKGPYRVNAHFESPSKTQQPLHHLSYHPDAYKDMLMIKRVGLSENDLLTGRMAKACTTSNCKEKYPTHRRGVDRFLTPADEFHEI